MAPPQAQPQPTLFWALFGLRGRISRRVYWLIQGALISVNSIVIAQMIGGPDASFNRLAQEVGPFLVMLTTASSIAACVKRLHDFGLTGFIAAALLLPIANVIVTIWAGIMPSRPGPNQYGSAPDRPR